MSVFKSYSQAAQDRFVVAVLNGKHGGTFIDVGCCHPIEISNTYALESHFAWRGLLVDNDHGAIDLCSKHRIGPAILADATRLDWDAAMKHAFAVHNAVFGDVMIARAFAFPRVIDYLSLDIDEASLDALAAILNTGARFRVITGEHDSYRNGDRLQVPMRALLEAHGYKLVCADVCSAEGLPFEDWWVDPMADGVDMNVAERLRCDGKKWTEIFPP